MKQQIAALAALLSTAALPAFAWCPDVGGDYVVVAKGTGGFTKHVEFLAIGTLTFNGGTVSGSWTQSIDGTISTVAASGSYVVDDTCQGTFTLVDETHNNYSSIFLYNGRDHIDAIVTSPGDVIHLVANRFH